MRVLLVIWACWAIMALPAFAKFATPAALPVSCETVRWYAARFPVKDLYAMAAAAGYKVTPGQVAAGRRCLRNQK